MGFPSEARAGLPEEGFFLGGGRAAEDRVAVRETPEARHDGVVAPRPLEQAASFLESLEAFEETRGLTAWAEKHREIIQRFGRFPHRNAILGRKSTPEEEEFLKRPGSSF